MMTAKHGSVLVLAWLGVLLIGSGCGGRRDTPPSPEAQADAKVKAIQRLADALAQNPDGPEARAALEDFRNIPFDARKYPNQAETIVEVYRQRIKGKYRGFVAEEIQMEMAGLENRPR
jgi:hypothetical protein